MEQVDPVAGESPFKLECKESVRNHMDALGKLITVMPNERCLKLSSLLPICNLIKAIVEKDLDSFNKATVEFKSLIAQKNNEFAPQNIPALAEINFLEGFESFLSYIHTENTPEDEEDGSDTHSLNSSIHNSPVRRKISPKRRASRRPENTKEKEDPVRRSARLQEILDDDDDEGVPVKLIRKSARHQSVESAKFVCVFNGCNEEFTTTKDLAAHADRCVHNADRVLVFRCSLCRRTYSDYKLIKLHHNRSLDCMSATIKFESEKKPRDAGGEKKLKNVIVPGEWRARRESLDSSIGGNNSKSQLIGCPFKKCTYSSDSFNHIHTHVQRTHPGRMTMFKCLQCGESRATGKAIHNHVQTCIGARIELKLTHRERTTRQSLHPPAEMKRKRGQPSMKTSSNKLDEEESDVDEIADMPVLEMIQLDDDEIMDAQRDETTEREESVDVVSIDEEEVDDAFNVSDADSSDI